ncbi:MAG: four helix bundle protein [Deltaproteobacteria bacterium]|nr:four helix bundle protein [Deltaproteobacteria bacterium]
MSVAKNVTQLIKSADSIGANIAEGTGRGSFKDNRRFARIARGSLFELKHWLRRAYKRELLSKPEVTSLHELIEELTPKLSAYINSIGKKSKNN